MQQLAPFVSFNIADQKRLLQTMGRHAHLIPMLAGSMVPMHVFQPAKGLLPTGAFVELFREALLVKPAPPSDEPIAAAGAPGASLFAMTVLSRFSIPDWLLCGPPSNQRLELFDCCARALRQETREQQQQLHVRKATGQAVDPATRTTPSESAHFFLSGIISLGSFQFPELLNVLFSYVLEGCRAGDLPPSIWTFLSQLPLDRLSWEHVCQICAQLHNYLWDMRKAVCVFQLS